MDLQAEALEREHFRFRLGALLVRDAVWSYLSDGASRSFRKFLHLLKPARES